MSSKTAKIFYSNYFLYLIIAKTARRLSVLHKLCRGYAALRVRLRLTNSKKDRRFCCKFTYLFVVPKQGAVEALPFPASGNPTAIICPMGKLTNDGIWKSSKNLRRGYAALRVRLRPHQYKNGTHNCSEFNFRTTKTGGGRGFAVSRRRESYGKNLPLGQIDERRHLEVLGKFCVGAMPRYESVYAPPIAKRDRRSPVSFLLLVGAVGLEPMTSTMSR